jgi:CRISPR type III-A-associated protein Csm2
MNQENKIFEGISPLNFNVENHEITGQIEKLETIVEGKFGKREEKEKNGEKSMVVKETYLSSTQLRNLYDKIKQCKNLATIEMLHPKIVYLAARQNNKSGKDIVMEIASFIKEIKTEEQLKSFKKFMEAIVAYQKYYYPSNN